jgi:hypothetical protein
MRCRSAERGLANFSSYSGSVSVEKSMVGNMAVAEVSSSSGRSFTVADFAGGGASVGELSSSSGRSFMAADVAGEGWKGSCVRSHCSASSSSIGSLK